MLKKIILNCICFTLLTLITQIGGFIWLLSLFISIKLKLKKRYVFSVLYLLFNVLIIPPIANKTGRKRLPVFNKKLQAKNIFYTLCFRNYVTKELYSVLDKSATELSKMDIQITYLDANFPFINGFPLLPHRSHNDGKKIDIAFMYLNTKGEPTTKKPTISGYGAYVKPNNYTTNRCLTKGYWQYDFPKYLTLRTDNTLRFDKKRTRTIIKTLLSFPQTEKIFIEPYLKQELNLHNSKIRFHGCKAVRHDDHLHLQIK